MINKRGLNEIISIALMLLLVVAAIAILWITVIYPSFHPVEESIDRIVKNFTGIGSSIENNNYCSENFIKPIKCKNYPNGGTWTTQLSLQTKLVNPEIKINEAKIIFNFPINKTEYIYNSSSDLINSTNATLNIVNITFPYLAENATDVNIKINLSSSTSGQECIYNSVCSINQNLTDNSTENFYQPKNENVLCIYNNNSLISSEICSFYLGKRPGAYSLGLDIPFEKYIPTWGPTKEAMNLSDFTKYIILPLMNWVDSHPEYKITHLAATKDIPTLVFGDYSDLKGTIMSGKLFLTFSRNFTSFAEVIAYKTDNKYGGKRIHFDPEDYKKENGEYTLRFAVSYLTGYTLEDVKKMIEKAQSPDQNLSQKYWIADTDTGVGVVKEEDLLMTKDSLIVAGIPESNIILERTNKPNITDTREIIGYGGPGSHHRGGPETNYTNYTRYWIMEAIDFPVSNKAIMTSYESTNAMTFTGQPDKYRTSSQDIIADAFHSNSTLGTHYSRSFSGAAGTVREPTLYGVNKIDRFFGAYANGLTLAESILSGGVPDGNSVGIQSITVGDPLMTLFDTDKKINGYSCNQDSDCYSGNCDSNPSGTKSCHANAENCVRDTFKETLSGNSICLNDNEIIDCVNSVWQNRLTCSSEKKCSAEPDNSNYNSLLEDYLSRNSSCRYTFGYECNQDSDCYGTKYDGGNCDADLTGIKRCHQRAVYCPIDSVSEAMSNSYRCFNESSKVFCQSGVWSNEKIYCEKGCENGLCIGKDEIFIPDTAFNFSKGSLSALTLPLIPANKSINEILKYPPWGSNIYIYRNGNYLVSSVISGAWSPNVEINMGEGFYFKTFFKNYFIELNGDPIESPIPVTLNGKWNMVGIPYCYSSYNASKLIREINIKDSSCQSIVVPETYNGLGSWFSLNNSLDYLGLYKDFNITNYGAYWIVCSNSTNTTWAPSC